MPGTPSTFETALQYVSKAIDNYPILPLRQPIVGRRLLSTNPAVKGFGITNVDTFTIGEMKDAVLGMDYPVPDVSRDRVSNTRNNIQPVTISQAFELTQDEILGYAQGNGPMIDILNQNIMSAVYKINKAEDNLIINGNTNLLGSNGGLYNASNICSYSTAASFQTSGKAAQAIVGAQALINAQNVYPEAYNLILNPAEWNHLLACSAANTNIPDIAWVKMLLNPGWKLNEFDSPSLVVPGVSMFSEPGSATPTQGKGGPMGGIYVTPAITAGTGLLLPVDPDRLWMQLFVTQDLVTDVGYDQRSKTFSPAYVTMAERIYPHVKWGQALCQLTNIA